jgi:predicted nucleic acid-binding protein
MTYLVDSTFVIDSLTARPYAASLLPTLLQDGIAVSSITHMELWEGVYGDRDPAAGEQRLRTFLRGVAIRPFSPRVSQRTAQLRRELRRRRLPLEQRALDILIAETALTHGLIMVTSDRDYDDIPGLQLLDPRTGQQRQNP